MDNLLDVKQSRDEEYTGETSNMGVPATRQASAHFEIQKKEPRLKDMMTAISDDLTIGEYKKRLKGKLKEVWTKENFNNLSLKDQKKVLERKIPDNAVPRGSFVSEKKKVIW